MDGGNPGYFRERGALDQPELEKLAETARIHQLAAFISSEILKQAGLKANIGFPGVSPEAEEARVDEAQMGLEAMNRLISNQEISNATQRTREAFYQKNFSSLRKKQDLSKKFESVRALMIEKLKNSVPDPKVRAEMVSRLKSVTLDEDGCMPPKGSPINSMSAPSSFGRAGNEYNSLNYKVKICDQTLFQNDSEFRIIQTLAHELSHAIDPCNIEGPVGTGFQYTRPRNVGESEQEYPIPGLLSCLRDSKSVWATRRAWLKDPERRSRDYLPVQQKDTGDQPGKNSSRVSTTLKQSEQYHQLIKDRNFNTPALSLKTEGDFWGCYVQIEYQYIDSYSVQSGYQTRSLQRTDNGSEINCKKAIRKAIAELKPAPECH